MKENRSLNVIVRSLRGLIIRKKFVGALLGAVLAFGQGFFHPPPAFAETKTVEADDEYIMGDGTDENQGIAKERARREAIRVASESVCVLVETFAESIDGELPRDQRSAQFPPMSCRL